MSIRIHLEVQVPGEIRQTMGSKITVIGVIITEDLEEDREAGISNTIEKRLLDTQTYDGIATT